MVKAIGHMTANLPPSDKVSHRTKARFASPTLFGAAQDVRKDAGAAKKVRKIKSRKR